MKQEQDVRARKSVVGALIGAGLALTAGLVPFDAPGFAQTAEEPRIVYQSGTVTAVHVGSVGINGKDHRLAAAAVVVTEKGQRVDATALKVDQEVQFHLDRLGQIDRLILILRK